MRRISSQATWFYKLVPIIWCSGFTLGVLMAISAVISGKENGFVLLCGMCVALIFSFVYFKTLRLSSLYDEVSIDGDDLVLRNRGQQDRVPIANIMNVDATIFANPERIELDLREPCAFGYEIVFLPQQRWVKYWDHHPIAEELRRRSGAPKQQYFSSP